jgi:hypothetical protein
MARRKDSPQKAAMREMMRDYLKNNDISIKDGTDVNSIMRDMIMNKRMYKILSAMKVEYYGAAGSSSIIRFCSWDYTKTIV